MNDKEERPGPGDPLTTGRFQKGRSGNPRGRPRKKATEPATRGVDPLRKMISAELSRPISIKDTDGQKTLTALEVTLRSLANNAMKGGILAQREVLALAAAEAEIVKAERQKTFDYWKNYKETMERGLAIISARGDPLPLLLPHPQDVELDSANLAVRCQGAFNEAEYETQQEVQKIQDLAYETSIILREKSDIPDLHGKGGTVGNFLLMYLTANMLLPLRLRRSPADYEQHIMSIAAKGRQSWMLDLEARCAEAGFPSCRTTQTWKLPEIPLSKLKIKLERTELLNYWLQQPRSDGRKSMTSAEPKLFKRRFDNGGKDG